MSEHLQRVLCPCLPSDSTGYYLGPTWQKVTMALVSTFAKSPMGWSEREKPKVARLLVLQRGKQGLLAGFLMAELGDQDGSQGGGRTRVRLGGPGWTLSPAELGRGVGASQPSVSAVALTPPSDLYPVSGVQEPGHCCRLRDRAPPPKLTCVPDDGNLSCHPRKGKVWAVILPPSLDWA